MYLPRAVLLVDRVADRPLGLLGPILFRRREVCEGAKIVVTNTEEITDGPTERFEADLASLQCRVGQQHPYEVIVRDSGQYG